MADICRTVTAYYDLSPFALVSNKRNRAVAHARQNAMYLCQELTEHSSTAIGRFFKRDHTTVLYARKVVLRRARSEEVQRQLTDLKNSLCAHRPPPGQEGYILRETWGVDCRDEGSAVRGAWA